VVDTARGQSGGAADPTQVPAWDTLLVDAAEVAYRGSEPPRPSRTQPLPAELHPSVVEALARRGVTELYTHQAATWEAAASGESVVVTTGTASGKSLAFSLPALDAIARDRTARALFLYPTKALAQDQARWLAGLGLPGLRPAIYDGDTPVEQRAHVRRTANAILTNPDMLHVGVLPHHDRWGDVLHNLRVVVVDEAHVYRGVFGSHVANVLRRLRRLALAYGADPLFVLASATIANAGELASRLTGLEVRVVDSDTAPRAERDIVLWNPELLDPELGIRASPLGDAARLLAELVGHGLRTICFTKSRKTAELVHRFASDRLDTATARRLAPYRAGYTPEQRRDIERRLVEQAFEQRAEIEPRSADDERFPPLLPRRFDPRRCMLRPRRRRGALRGLRDVDAEVRNARALLDGRLGRPDVEAAVHLSRIRADDRRRFALGQP